MSEFITLESYGEGACFLEEGEPPQPTDSRYERKTGQTTKGVKQREETEK